MTQDIQRFPEILQNLCPNKYQPLGLKPMTPPPSIAGVDLNQEPTFSAMYIVNKKREVVYISKVEKNTSQPCPLHMKIATCYKSRIAAHNHKLIRYY